jgi:hypothetical protein
MAADGRLFRRGLCFPGSAGSNGLICSASASGWPGLTKGSPGAPREDCQIPHCILVPKLRLGMRFLVVAPVCVDGPRIAPNHRAGCGCMPTVGARFQRAHCSAGTLKTCPHKMPGRPVTSQRACMCRYSAGTLGVDHQHRRRPPPGVVSLFGQVGLERFIGKYPAGSIQLQKSSRLLERGAQSGDT